MASEWTKREGFERALADELARRPRDDLTPVRGGADSGRDVHVQADVSLLAHLGLARMDADAHANRLFGRPRLVGEGPLELDRSGHGIPRPLEGEEDSVSGPIHLVSTVFRGRRADKRAGACPHFSVSLAPERVDKPRRALHVREKQRDRALRQARVHALPRSVPRRR